MMETTHVRTNKAIQFYNELSELLTKYNAKFAIRVFANSDNETVSHIFTIIDNNQSIDITELSNTDKL